MLIVGHAGEHDISPVLFGILVLYGSDWSNCRLLGRRRRQKAVTLGDPGEPVALPSGVVGRLRAAVEFAGRVKSLLIRESRQPIGLAALLALGWRLPFRLLVFDCRHLPACGSWLHGLALVVAWLLAPTGVASRGSSSLRGYFARRINLNFCLHGGVDRGIFICYDQKLVKGAGSSHWSRCLRRVPSQHPVVKYSIACTSCTPLQELRSSAQRVR